MKKLKGNLSLFENPNCASKETLYPNELKHIFDIKNVPQAVKDIQCWPGYKVTPLQNLTNLAKDLNLKKIWYKDESNRLGLGSFKALGGAYAVALQIIAQLKEKHDIDCTIPELLKGSYKKEISEVKVSCATDGNHGRSVAWGAQMFGCECVIYIHRHVSPGREEAMKKYGAKVIRIEGNYDDSVKMASEDAKVHDRLIVSDTSFPGYMEIPKDVALGYTVMLEEIVEQLKGEIPTHIIVQGGVGGLASAVCAYAWQKWGNKRPRFIIVEPEQANCLQESAKENKPVVVTGELETLMAGLACGEVSLLAWDILSIGTNDFTTINEETIAPSMKYLAELGIEAGESAVPGIPVLASTPENKLGLNKESTVLLFGTEGATDPKLYEELTGIKPQR